MPDLVFSQIAMETEMTAMTVNVANNAFIAYFIILNPMYDNANVLIEPMAISIQ